MKTIKSNTIQLFLIAILFGTLFFSCKKDDEKPEDPDALAQIPIPVDISDPAAPVSFDYKDILSAAGVRDGSNLEEVPSEQKPEPLKVQTKPSTSLPSEKIQTNRIRIPTQEGAKIPERFTNAKLPNQNISFKPPIGNIMLQTEFLNQRAFLKLF